MWYYLAQFLVGVYTKVYFRKIYFTGLDKLPKDKPLILACNHPTAFIEPIIIGGASSQGRNFILRGDMFGKSKVATYFLREVKCVPIYRFRDGFSAMKKNEETLQYCYDLLGEGENIFILAEGTSKFEKRMRTIQKGTARMAFGAYEKHQRIDIAIVPIGINYSNALKFRSVVYADFGTPIPISEYMEAYTENPRKGIKKLTDALSNKMRQKIIHIANEDDDELGNQLLEIEEHNAKEKPFPRLTYQPSPLPKMWAKIERLNVLPPEQKEYLRQKSKDYFEQLTKLGLQDKGIAQNYANSYYFLQALALLIGLPAFLVGILGNFIPIKMGKYYGEKLANAIEFKSALRFVFEMFIYCLYFLLLLIVAFWVGNIWYIAFVVLLPIFGQFSLLWLDSFRKWWAKQQTKRISDELLQELKEKREELARF